jgi:hypothetical protein
LELAAEVRILFIGFELFKKNAIFAAFLIA